MNHCPYCKSPGTSYFQIGARIYNLCPRCGLIYRSDCHSYDDVVNTFSERYFQKYSTDQLDGARAELFQHILKVLEEKSPPGRLLDVGTGCGFFLAAAKRRGWQVQGIEPSLESVEISRKHTGVPVLHGTLRECDGRDRFDAVTFINVLDHSALPWLEIDCAGKLLRPGGQIYLRFPNGYLHSRIYRMAYNFGLSDLLRKFLVFHMYSFTPKYIRELLHDYGFVDITILNSPPSKGDPHGLFPHTTLAAFIKILIYSIGQLAKTVSWGKLFLGTSLEVTATKPL